MSSSANSSILVMIIRHGEKLGDSSNDKDDGPNLSMRGSARAAALPQLFAPAAMPDGCALTKAAKLHRRLRSRADCRDGAAVLHTGLYIRDERVEGQQSPVETITPLSAGLNLTYDDKRSDSDYAQVRERHSDAFAH